jgi:hypothetical protein
MELADRSGLCAVASGMSVCGGPKIPWERHYTSGELTPCRVRRAVSALLVALGTPPKLCGRSPEQPKGRRSGRAKHYPARKKSV